MLGAQRIARVVPQLAEPRARRVAAPKILIVDDEASILRGLARALAVLRPTWSIQVAGSGYEALRHLERSPYDVLVTDLEMPGLDGIGLLQRVKDSFPDMARLVHSSRPEWPSRDLEYLAVDSLRKPAPPADIVFAIERALQAPSFGSA